MKSAGMTGDCAPGGVSLTATLELVALALRVAKAVEAAP
jgi:hypothetical protein